MLTQPVQREVGKDVRGVPLDHGRVRGRADRRVVIGTLPDQHLIVIKARRRGLQVPLADHGRLVACLPQHFRHGGLRTVERLSVRVLPVHVAVLSRQHRCPARRADRIRDQAVVEEHAFIGEAVDVGRVVHAGAVGADRGRRVVVTEDEQDVRSRRLGFGGAAGEQQGCKQGGNNGADGHGHAGLVLEVGRLRGRPVRNGHSAASATAFIASAMRRNRSARRSCCCSNSCHCSSSTASRMPGSVFTP